MAWSAPANPWTAVAEVMTSAKMNILANDVRYLKGLDGAITLDDLLGLRGAPTYTLDVLGADAAASGVRVRADGFTNVPVPGAISDATVINARGFNLTTDGVLVGSTYRPGLGIGMAASRVTPLLALNNAGGPSILVEAGNVGIGTAAPQGKLHGYDAIGGFLHWKYDGVDSTLRTVIPNGTGDVLYRVACLYVARSSGGTTLGGSISAALSSTTTLLTDGGTGDVLAMHVAADGSVDVQRTSGTAVTFKVALWLTWI